ncbi:zonular occludens toxin domain-containing protein [Aeromonas caviae]
MITLITGTPGSGKTLRCVEILAELRDSADPKVRSRLIFSNIADLAPEIGAVTEFDPLCWMDLPEGSLIVVDEFQDFWPSRPSGSKRPESVAALNTHRHKGVDFILLTQHPGLVDQDIRALVGRHLHAYRPRGLEHSMWYEWSYCELSCQPKLKPIPEKRKFNREIFSLYKSTVENTHKPQSWLPIIKKAALPLLGICGGLVLLVKTFSGIAHQNDDLIHQNEVSTIAAASAATPLYQAPDLAAATGPVSGAVALAAPVRSALPVLAYHGWQKFRGKTELLLCQEIPAGEGGEGGGCAVNLTWDQVVHWREEGGTIIVMGGPNGPDLWQITDRLLWVDAVEQGIQLAKF